MSNIAIVVGTRPEIIKMAPVIRTINSTRGLSHHLIHTNQHYDDEMSGNIFADLNLPAPDEHLGIGSGTHGKQVASALTAIEDILIEWEFELVLAQGDTNAVLSTAIAASKLPVSFGHIESGIRSYDRSMPEEVNRVLTDSVTDLAFAPTEDAAENLATEGITENVYVTGNTVVDACIEHISIAESRSTILAELDLKSNKYVTATIHRPLNTDDRGRLTDILVALDDVDFHVVLPAHPRTQSVLEELSFEPGSSLNVIGPLDYLDFLNLEANSRAIVTDSGGVQEEASILQVPCLTVRPNTERPETVEKGVNVLVDPDELTDKLSEVYRNDTLNRSMQGASEIYGDGTAGEQITDIITTKYL